MHLNFLSTAALLTLALAATTWAQPVNTADQAGDSVATPAPADVLRLDIITDQQAAFNDWPQIPELAIGIGYANFGIGGSGSDLDNESMLRFEPVLSIAPFTTVPQLRVGIGCGVGLDFDDSSLLIISNENGLSVFGHSSVPLWTVEPELRLSWRQYIGSQRLFCVEPGVAVGAVYAHLHLDSDDGTTSFDSSDTAAMGRVFVNLGWRQGVGSAGLQASYMVGERLDLAENASGDVHEFYIGFFGSIRF